MRRPPVVLLAAVALIALPAVVVAASAAVFHLDNSDRETLMAPDARGYTVHVPSGYDPSRPTPLVLSFHGAALWGRAQQALSTWDEVADREGFIVVYPTARGRRGPRAWRVAPPRPEGPSIDVSFVAALIDSLSANYNVDPRRVYANGLSNGGGMSWLLSCELSDRIAAVGLVGAAFTIPTAWCADRPPVPAIMFHGTADEDAPYNGGSSWIARHLAFPSIPGVAAEWARRNGCSAAYTDSSLAGDVLRRAWPGCEADVVLYTVIGGGHTWPGGRHTPAWFTGRTTRSIDASATMWDFFQEASRRTRQ